MNYKLFIKATAVSGKPVPDKSIIPAMKISSSGISFISITSESISSMLAVLLFVVASFIIGCTNSGQATPTESAREDSTTKSQKSDAVSTKTMYINADGGKLAYRKIGSGSPLILCNRFRGIMDDWDPAFLDELAKNYTVITFDYSGIGLSAPANKNDSLKELADITNLAAHFGYSRFSLIGWSHGGKVAQVYAASNSDKVDHLVLLGSGPIGKNRFKPETIFLDHALKPVNDFEDEIILFFEPRYEDSREAAKRSHARMKTRTTDTSVYVTPEKFQKYFETVALYNSNESAKEILFKGKLPMLAISGEHDIVFPIESWYEQTRQNPNLQIIMLPRAGHGPQSQYPTLTAGYIHSFLSAKD